MAEVDIVRVTRSAYTMLTEKDKTDFMWELLQLTENGSIRWTRTMYSHYYRLENENCELYFSRQVIKGNFVNSNSSIKIPLHIDYPPSGDKLMRAIEVTIAPEVTLTGKMLGNAVLNGLRM